MRTIMWGVALVTMAAVIPTLAQAGSMGRYYAAGAPKRAILYPDWNGSPRDGCVPYIRQRSIDRAGATIIPGGRVFELRWRCIR